MFALSRRLPTALAPLALGIACACGGVATASEVATDGEAKVLPVLNAQSGQVEALLLLDSDASGIAPLDRLFPRSGALPGIGIHSPTPSGAQLRASLQPDRNAGLALLCNQGVQVAVTLGPLSQQCLLAQISGHDELLPASSPRPGLVLDAGWRSADGTVDMSFGLSWLEGPLTSAQPAALPGPGEIAALVPSLPALAPVSLGELSLRQAHWTGRIDLGAQRWLSAGASIGSQEMNLLLEGPQRWDSATVTLGVDFRGLSGRLTGRLIELPRGQGNVRGLDLGISWRTPWQGEISFGAQNLLNQAPDTSKWPLSELPALEAPGGRTPYVRYKQDL